MVRVLLRFFNIFAQEMEKRKILTALLRPIAQCRTLMFFMVLMAVAITIFGNMMDAVTDPFLSSLLPLFDCYLLCLLSAGLKKIRLGFIVPVLVTIILFSELFTVFFYHSNFTPYVLLLLFETNPKESSEFIHAALTQGGTWYAVAVTLLMGTLAFLLAKGSRRLFKGKNIVIGVLSVLILWSGIRQLSAYKKLFECFISQSTSVCNDPRYIPHLNTPFIRLAYGAAYNIASSAELDVLERSVAVTHIDSCSYRCPLIVLIIGESYNKHHAQLYGYHLPTTPRMQEEQEAGRLFAYQDAVAPYNFTSNAFKEMFSTYDKEEDSDWTRHTLFPTLFKKSGYHVAFYTNQFAAEQTNIWDMAGGTIFNHHGLSRLQFSERNEHVYPYDGELVHELPSIDSLTARPTLLIVHFIGQHVSYDTRYPTTYTHFTPADEQTPFGGSQGKTIAAHYDNATYYNDSVVAVVFEKIHHQDAIAIYLSDHGEEVYDWRDKYERTNEGTLYPEVARYQYEIPLLFFLTDTFQVRHPDITETVKRGVNRRFYSSDLPHLLLGLGGIFTTEYKEKRNILSPKYDLNRKRMIRNDVDYDELMKGNKP